MTFRYSSDPDMVALGGLLRPVLGEPGWVQGVAWDNPAEVRGVLSDIQWCDRTFQREIPWRKPEEAVHSLDGSITGHLLVHTWDGSEHYFNIEEPPR